MNRRKFLQSTTAAAGSAVLGSGAALGQSSGRADQTVKPNIILYLSDQFRWDFVGANGANSSTQTPNLDAMAERGTNFTHCITNQPVCAPSRSVLFTSRYATETNVWHNGPGMKQDLPTLAGELRKAGYTSNLIGKWHLAPGKSEGGGPGPVPEEWRGGFLDLWEGANALEHTTHPYEGTIYDRDGKEITYKDQYRVDFITDRAEHFLRQKHDKPFFLFVSQLEPHQQNDMNRMVGPKGSAERFINAHVPPDLRAFPGDWHQQLPDYYGACESIDASVGRLHKVLEETGQKDNTIFVFFSDHGCHFMTRNQEYKRSTHNSSLRVPFLIDGPGFNRAQQINELVSIIDFAPTLLKAAGVPVPSSWKGQNVLPLLDGIEARQAWPNKQLVQISESMTARSIRTKDWTYCVADVSGGINAANPSYMEWQLYDQRNDPYELTNLAGRKEYKQKAKELRAQLLELMKYAGETAEIQEAKLYH
ncbi:MAG: sulfatase-like hydrolase/transferase [Edaphobacter sp.]|uniref:sulfatase-like hydrolase/transferase n=1 Tax=Edaphobacter sp. TaxID=1934404 RepID=UPI00238E383A|nr:sulfatase-like hydrolase/transferase [Edaphobacter sp.]MDE1177998.1 sulfatase-like hydrolase/transferase [Edaphobacter sp.]